MGFDQELEADRKKPTATTDVTPTPGRASTVDSTPTTTDGTAPEAKTDPEARIKELIAQLEKQFGRRRSSRAPSSAS